MTAIDRLIKKAHKNALSGKILDREDIISLLEINPDSGDAEELGKAAREAAAEITENRGRVWAAIGVDFAPCPVNCHFCSFGEKWGVAKEVYEWTGDEIVEQEFYEDLI